MTDYQVLGVNPGASQDEIKRAYFSQIRQHSPEKDPDAFQAIRAAYERLAGLSADNGVNHIPWERPANRDAWPLYDLIMTYDKNQDYTSAAKTAEKAAAVFPDELVFHIMLACLYLSTGYPGKAAREAEILVHADPQSIHFNFLMGQACLERGWFKKALPYLKTVYDSGDRSLSFILSYIHALNANGASSSLSVIMDTLKEHSWNQKETLELSYLLFLLSEIQESGKADPAEYNQILISFFTRNPSLFTVDVVAQVAPKMLFSISHIPDPAPVFDFIRMMKNQRAMTDAEYAVFVSFGYHEMLEKDTYLAPSPRESFKKLLQAESVMQFPSTRFRDVMPFGYVLDDPELFQDIIQMSQADAELLYLDAVSDHSVILHDADILQKDYPLLYERFAAFFAAVKDGADLESLHTQLLQELKTCRTWPTSLYASIFPENLGFTENPRAYNSKTIVNSGPKIGRNDPCPCGSGKKYKNCCMKKASGGST